jgi:hypothetical protein
MHHLRSFCFCLVAEKPKENNRNWKLKLYKCQVFFFFFFTQFFRNYLQLIYFTFHLSFISLFMELGFGVCLTPWKLGYFNVFYVGTLSRALNSLIITFLIIMFRIS